MHAMLLECPEPLSQIGAGRVETLKDGLEALFGDGFHSHQRALDAGPAHRVEKLRVFTGFHRDLSEKRPCHREAWLASPSTRPAPRASLSVPRHEPRWPASRRAECRSG